MTRIDNAPHTPRGCIAQAWSVAAVIRAKLAIKQAQEKVPADTVVAQL